jgi:hypothetical protein
LTKVFLEVYACLQIIFFIMLSFVPIRESSDAGERVVSGVGNLLHGGVTVNQYDHQYDSLFSEHSDRIKDMVSSYLAEFREKIGMVVLGLNDYRDSLGIDIVSVSMKVLDESGKEMLLDGEVKAPTIGFATPLISAGTCEESVRAGFQVEDGVVEEITALSDELLFGASDAEGVETSMGTDSLNRGEMLVVSGGGYVAAELDLFNKGQAVDSGLLFQIRGGHDVPEQVYFCRYRTAQAVNDVVPG